MKITDRLQILKGNFTVTIAGIFTANRNVILPDKNGTIALLTDIPQRLNRLQGGIFDHFIGNFSSTAPASRFEFTSLIVGAVAAISNISGEANNPGIVRMSTGTTSSGSLIIQSPTTILFGSQSFIFKATVRLPNISDVSDTFVIRVGFGDRMTSSPFSIVDSAFFSIDAGGFWTNQTRSNGVSTIVTSSVSVAANTFYDLEIRINASGSVADFLIDNVNVASITTNIPVGIGRDTGLMVQIVKSVGTNSRSLDIDFMALEWGY